MPVVSSTSSNEDRACDGALETMATKGTDSLSPPPPGLPRLSDSYAAGLHTEDVNATCSLTPTPRPPPSLLPASSLLTSPKNTDDATIHFAARDVRIASERITSIRFVGGQAVESSLKFGARCDESLPSSSAPKSTCSAVFPVLPDVSSSMKALQFLLLHLLLFLL